MGGGERSSLKKQRARLIKRKMCRENLPEEFSTLRQSSCSQDDDDRRKDRI